MKKLIAAALLGLMTTFGAGSANAAFPEKPLNVVIAFAPGGTSDISVRMLAPKLEKIFGQPLVITNKGGGAGVPGLNTVLQSKPDGYTASAPATPAFSAALFLRGETMNLDEMSFACGYMINDRILLVKNDKPYKNWQEFIAYCKANPGKVSIGSGASQAGMEVMKSIAIKEGLDVNFVMYKSGGEASADLIGGHIDACELGVGTAAYQAARKGELSILANLGTGDVPDFPNVPKLHKDLGYDFQTAVPYAFILPKGTPEDIRACWENAVKQALEDPEIQETMLKAGFSPKFMTGKEVHDFCVEELKSIPAMLEYNKQLKK
ncbi:MAG: tripartite tricarboxylate transporter substrate binding protein [Mailhella sp.]|nr:tripartite tricarboxylate transporter substrate binding protein [Mailhella sp.]